MADINSFIVYGHPKSGKTTMTAHVMNNAVWVVTRKENLGGFNSWLRQNPDEAAKHKLRYIMPREDAEKAGLDLAEVNTSVVQVPRMLATPEGKLVRNDVPAFIKNIAESYVAKVSAGQAKTRGIVFDELSVLARWAYEHIKENERNGFEVIARIKDWVGYLCELSAVTHLPMAFICHEKDPSYHEDGPKQGKIKYKGGPAMPVGTLIGEVCSLPDAIFQLVVRQQGVSDTKRVLLTSPHPDYERGVRVWGLEPEMEPDLRVPLSLAGWTF